MSDDTNERPLLPQSREERIFERRLVGVACAIGVGIFFIALKPSDALAFTFALGCWHLCLWGIFGSASKRGTP